MAKLKRESAREQIRDSILKGIHDGKYQPGFQLKEKILADSFGTSQAPVREALRELEGLQYIETIPYKGSIVKEVKSEDLVIAYKLRRVFEQMAMESIIEQKSFDLSELETLAEKIDDAAKIGDKELYSKLNVQFHEYFINHSDSAMLKRMWKLVTFPTQIETVLDTVEESLEKFSKEHFLVIDALRDNDCKKACSLLSSHIENIEKKIKK